SSRDKRDIDRPGHCRLENRPGNGCSPEARVCRSSSRLVAFFKRSPRDLPNRSPPPSPCIQAGRVTRHQASLAPSAAAISPCLCVHLPGLIWSVLLR
ncbi:unnamed protein product, partial [Mycena citricolor]